MRALRGFRRRAWAIEPTSGVGFSAHAPVEARPGRGPGGVRSMVRVPSFKPAYLIHGDDHGRIGERRARLRELAEKESGVSGVEVFEGESASPDAVAAALSAMTFAMGRRFVIVDGVERWKDSEVTATVAPALAAIDGDTTVAFFAREEGRAKAPAKLADAVKRGRRRRRRRDDAEGPGPAALAGRRGEAARGRARRRGRPGADRPRRGAPAAPAARARDAGHRARPGRAPGR